MFSLESAIKRREEKEVMPFFSLEAATERANRYTKVFGIYFTAVPTKNIKGGWVASSRYHPA